MDNASAPETLRVDAAHIVTLGQPLQRKVIAGESVLTHDKFGLPIDPIFYAKNSCMSCYGQGAITVHHRADPRDDVRSDEQSTKSVVVCRCALLRYEKARREIETRRAK